MFHLADEDSRSATGNKTFGAVAAADSPDDAAFFLELVQKVSGAGGRRKWGPWCSRALDDGFCQGLPREPEGGDAFFLKLALHKVMRDQVPLCDYTAITLAFLHHHL